MACKVDEALASYGAALEVFPDYLPALQGIASLTVRAKRKDDRLTGWLEAIAMRSESSKWRDWALSKQPRVRSPQ
jgi:hypothetical protein